MSIKMYEFFTINRCASWVEKYETKHLLITADIDILHKTLTKVTIPIHYILKTIIFSLIFHKKKRSFQQQ